MNASSNPAPYFLTGDLAVIPQAEPVPGMGVLPVLSYVLLGEQPVVVDTGTIRHQASYLSALESLLDPKDVAWIVLTHPDGDHAGALPELLRRAPKARLVSNWIGTGKLSCVIEPPAPRLRWVNAGESLAVGDRVLYVFRPPMYDCPSTFMVLDSKTRALFASDAFGAFVPREAQRLSELSAAEVSEALEGMSTFCRVNSPWLQDLRPERYHRPLEVVRDLAPSWLLSAHLPAVSGADVQRVVKRASTLTEEGRVPLPGQQALEAALANLAQAA